MRTIGLDLGLTGELKRRVPCYTFQNKNDLLLHTFIDYRAILFFKGALRKDAAGILIRQTENPQAGRRIRFAGVGEIFEIESIVKA